MKTYADYCTLLKLLHTHDPVFEVQPINWDSDIVLDPRITERESCCSAYPDNHCLSARKARARLRIT